jgi:hypothetical protein
MHRGFKGLKQAIKLEFKLARYDKVNMAAIERGSQANAHRLLNTTRSC